MFGAIVKTYYAEKMGINPKNIVSVSIMPCTAKKFEIGRDNQNGAGIPDVDISLTTRELARLIRKVGLNFERLPEEDRGRRPVDPAVADQPGRPHRRHRDRAGTPGHRRGITRPSAIPERQGLTRYA